MTAMHKLCSAGGLALLAILAGSAPTLALTQDEISNYKGADRQKMLEEGAKKEGEVSWYATFNVELAVTPLGEAFEKKYGWPTGPAITASPGTPTW